MQKFKAILFDMDGTLLPMNMKEFTNGYFKLLCKKLAPYGLDNEKLVAAIWDGTAAMVKNNGEQKNVEVFWKRFEEIMGISPEVGIAADCDDFYGNEFRGSIQYTQPNPLAAEAVKAAHEAAPVVALATNPLFPMAGQRTRMDFVGLSEDDFALVSAYETDRFCKPNPNYYLDFCARIGVDPADCLMVGNDEFEDMYAAKAAGMKECYLVTDTMIPDEKHPWNGPRGTFAELVEYLKNLKD